MTCHCLVGFHGPLSGDHTPLDLVARSKQLRLAMLSMSSQNLLRRLRRIEKVLATELALSTVTKRMGIETYHLHTEAAKQWAAACILVLALEGAAAAGTVAKREVCAVVEAAVEAAERLEDDAAVAQSQRAAGVCLE